MVGAAGRMGQALAENLNLVDGLVVSAMVDLREPARLFGGSHFTSLERVAPSEVDVVVDFSQPDSVVTSAQWCARHRRGLVIGTTGLSDVQQSHVEVAAAATGVVMASNFSLGAVLSERFAAMAAPYFERVEIIELHHDRKVDAPSGTSIATAAHINDARRAAGRVTPEDPTRRVALEGARGADAGGGVRIHSVRLPGLVAHQEVLFGGAGEGLTIRHDSYDRVSFVQGVAIAVNHVDATPGFTWGIDDLIA
ncbi:MAG: 4-hydroxy-tetrahydrodipicolinate reductase [Acidobacteria bacterium]|nr:4-hydroxy-tetrahydrodipicolinate reductase [Acidobacteriota bacterium]